MESSTAWSRNIAARVNEAISLSGLSVREVAARSGIARETLRRRLDNLTPFIVNELETLASVLDVDSDFFLNPAHWPEAS